LKAAQPPFFSTPHFGAEEFVERLTANSEVSTSPRNLASLSLNSAFVCDYDVILQLSKGNDVRVSGRPFAPRLAHSGVIMGYSSYRRPKFWIAQFAVVGQECSFVTLHLLVDGVWLQFCHHLGTRKEAAMPNQIDNRDPQIVSLAVRLHIDPSRRIENISDWLLAFE
jgi:hypothetical protein